MQSMWLILIFMTLLGHPSFGQAEEPVQTRVLFILDVSQSMGSSLSGYNKLEIAKRIIREAVDSLHSHENTHVALRVYGHQYHHTINNCNDTKLLVGFGPNSDILIKSRLRELKPNGITPIAKSLEKVQGDFPAASTSRNIVVLVTDGEESCDGDPCKVAAQLQAKNIILKPFVIGLGYQSELKTNLDCIGSYYEANNEDEFNQVMKEILSRILNQTTVTVNLLDQKGRPTETDVNLTFLNAASKTPAYNFYHTLTARGISDTMRIDPVNTYHLIVHTLPPIVKRDLKLKINTHNVIDIAAPQGYLLVKMQNSNTRYVENIPCIVRQTEVRGTVNVQPLNSKEKYLAGNYEMVLLTLPRITLKDIRIQPNEITTVEIPEPGLLTINSKVEVYGGIFRLKENRLEKIYQLNDRILQESLLLQPGEYWVIYRNKIKKSAEATLKRKIRIQSGQSATINL